MKARVITVLFLLLIALAGLPAADFKVATIDLQRLLSEYYKAQEGLKALQQKEASFTKELESLRLEGRRMIDEAESLRRLTLEPVLSVVERERKKQEFELKLADLRGFDARYERERLDRAASLQSQADRLNKRLIEDVLLAARAVGEREGCNLILNASRIHPESSDVLFGRGLPDLTQPTLARLNASKP